MKIFLWTLLLAQVPAAEREWSFEARHDHAFGSCEGQLIIAADSVRFETTDGEDSRTWSYPDIEFFEVVSASRIRVHTYEHRGAFHLWRERAFTLDLTDGSLTSDIYAFLRDRSPRAVLMRDPSLADNSAEAPVAFREEVVQELPVRHDHSLGGCQGLLEIREGSIVYPNDSRLWRLADLESFASNGDFELRVSTRNETFRFDLKAPLEEETYRHIWRAVYSPRLQSYRGGVR